jgi:hypothetical protein
MAAGDGHRFIAPASDVVSYDHPSGQEVAITCSGRIEFTLLETGTTEMLTVHRHNMVGGKWFHRWSIRRSSPATTDRAFQEAIIRCQSAVDR